MTDEIEWPREIWLAELDQHHNGQAHAVLSEHATVARWEGDEERDREFHKYVDADIYDSAEKYQTERLRIALERAEKAENELALVTAQLEAAQEAFPAKPGLMRQRMAERAGSAQHGAEPAKDGDKPREHWGVDVRADGETILTIETECLSGRELSERDEEIVRTAARHLLSFVGEPAGVSEPAGVKVREAITDLKINWVENGENNGQPIYTFKGFGQEARIVFGFSDTWGVVVDFAGERFAKEQRQEAFEDAERRIKENLLHRLAQSERFRDDISELAALEPGQTKRDTQA